VIKNKKKNRKDHLKVYKQADLGSYVQYEGQSLIITINNNIDIHVDLTGMYNFF